MNLFNKKAYFYKAINLFLNKLSEGKLIIFYTPRIKDILFFSDLNTFQNIIIKYKYIITINCNRTKYINDINNFIFQNDVLFFLNNLIFRKKIKKLIKVNKNNKIIAFVNNTKKIKKLYKYTNLKIFFSNY